MNCSVENVFARFRQLAATAGLLVSDEVLADLGRVCVALVAGGDAGLRLAWDQDGQILRLEISHGPPEGVIAGWLELRRERCEGSCLPTPESPEESFQDAIEYGLELIGEDRQGT